MSYKEFSRFDEKQKLRFIAGTKRIHIQGRSYISECGLKQVIRYRAFARGVAITELFDTSDEAKTAGHTKLKSIKAKCEELNIQYN